MARLFISYNKADRLWAEWVASILEEAGNSVIFQLWDFRPGGNFILEMQEASAKTDKTIAILSNSYLNAEYTHPEWAAAFAKDPMGKHRSLIPIRVEECRPQGVLAQVIYVDIVGLSEQEAKSAVLKAFSERGKLDSQPYFPGSSL